MKFGKWKPLSIVQLLLQEPKFQFVCELLAARGEVRWISFAVLSFACIAPASRVL